MSQPHKWKPIESSRGKWGIHRYECSECGKETHIGLDIDYGAPECKGLSTKSVSASDTEGE